LARKSLTDSRHYPKAARVRFLANEHFVPQSEPTSLDDGEIHVWFFPRWPDVRDSAKSPIVREWLARYLDTAVANVRVDVQPNGKPRLHDGSLHFNVSHSGNAMLLALSRKQEIGVDLEFSRRPRRVVELAERWFDPAEAAALQLLPESLRQTAFLNLWTCKEAVLKADGGGIASGLHRIAFLMNETGEIDSAIDRSWNVVRLEPEPGYPGAVAWQGADVPVRTFVYAAR
jgi:4'-phosphopantetheinyl transferase